MTTAQVILLIVGIVFVILSFFVVDRNNEVKTYLPMNDLVSREATEEELAAMRQHIQDILDEETAKYMNDTKDKLSNISNESIMSVHEYSDQVLAKIEHNNEEVVFLYNMLTNKEEEFKSIWSKMELARRENKELLDRIAELKLARARSLENRAQRAEVSSKETGENSDSVTAKQNNNIVDKAPAVKSQKNNEGKKENEELDQVKTQITLDLQDIVITDEELGQNKNEEILKLYKQKKSVMDISKQLGLGQGEVKLVIDLYGQK